MPVGMAAGGWKLVPGEDSSMARRFSVRIRSDLPEADYSSKWIVSRWRTQRPNRRRSDSECYGDVTPVTTNAACRGFQLGRDLPDDAAASVARAATSTGRGCAVDIPGCIDGHRTDRTGSVTSTGKIVQICLRPAALGRRQLK